MRKFRVTINGDKWIVKLLPHKEFKKDWPNTEAVTVYKHADKIREIIFSDKYFTKGHVVHEVLHAYFSYCDLSNKSYGTVEEDICEYLDDRFTHVNRVINNIYGKLARV